MKKASITALMVASSAIALSGCEVEKTEDGKMPNVDVAGDAGNLPKYDVDVRKTEEGRMPNIDVDVDGGKLPEYDVRGPDISIGTKETTIKVPDVDVDMKEKQITVPDIDIDIPDNDNDVN